MVVSGQIVATAALPPGKGHPLSIEWEASWAPESLWTKWRREKSPLPPRIETRSSNP